MTYSLSYGDLLKRQAELQRLSNMPAASLEQVRVALLTEIGELAQELKPDWAWWSKPGAKKEVDREKVLGEAADVLHFVLLEVIVAFGLERACKKYGHYEVRAIITKPDDLAFTVQALAETRGIFEMSAFLCDILARYGFTPADLARAYWEKTEVNLERWRKADEA